jgi:hypothetical protein
MLFFAIPFIIYNAFENTSRLCPPLSYFLFMHSSFEFNNSMNHAMSFTTIISAISRISGTPDRIVIRRMRHITHPLRYFNHPTKESANKMRGPDGMGHLM